MAKVNPNQAAAAVAAAGQATQEDEKVSEVDYSALTLNATKLMQKLDKAAKRARKNSDPRADSLAKSYNVALALVSTLAGMAQTPAK